MRTEMEIVEELMQELTDEEKFDSYVPIIQRIKWHTPHPNGEAFTIKEREALTWLYDAYERGALPDVLTDAKMRDLLKTDNLPIRGATWDGGLGY